MTSAELLDWLAALPPGDRDRAVEEWLGLGPPVPSAPPGEHLIGYHASGVAAIVRALVEVPVTRDDVLVDLGAGLGKVVLLTRFLTGAKVGGVELQPDLAERGRRAAAALELDVTITTGDVRDAELDGGSVFFLYLPFTGTVLAEVLARLHVIAARRQIVVCTLGLDLEAPWLARRPVDAFWLAIYDSVVDGAEVRSRRTSELIGEAAGRIAYER